MKITAIEPQIKDKNRASLYIDNKFSCGLYLDIIWQFRLKVGQEISEQELSQVQQADNLQRTFSKALDHLSRRPRTQFEMEQYLRQRLIYKHPDWAELEDLDKESFKEQQEKSLAQLMDKLQQQGYIDDLAFAKWWIDNRLAFKPRGPRLLQQELRAKGVPSHIIDQVLADYQQDGQLNQLDQAKELANKYLKKQSESDSAKLKQKLARHLASKGYDWEIISQVWNDLYS